MANYRKWGFVLLLLLMAIPVTVLSAEEQMPTHIPPHLRLIEGSPLSISIANDGRYQMTYVDRHNFPTHATGALYLWYDGCEVVPQTTPLSGADLATWIPLGQSQVSGAGVQTSPWRVTTKLKAVCDQLFAQQALTVESVASYANAADYFHLSLAVCGGETGTPVETALLTQSANQAYPRAEARASALFDDSGCADFSILWTFGAAPQSPLSLELLSVETKPAPDITSLIGFGVVGLAFLTLVGLWLGMIRPYLRR